MKASPKALQIVNDLLDESRNPWKKVGTDGLKLLAFGGEQSRIGGLILGLGGVYQKRKKLYKLTKRKIKLLEELWSSDWEMVGSSMAPPALEVTTLPGGVPMVRDLCAMLVRELGVENLLLVGGSIEGSYLRMDRKEGLEAELRSRGIPHKRAGNRIKIENPSKWPPQNDLAGWSENIQSDTKKRRRRDPVSEAIERRDKAQNSGQSWSTLLSKGFWTQPIYQQRVVKADALTRTIISSSINKGMPTPKIAREAEEILGSQVPGSNYGHMGMDIQGDEILPYRDLMSLERNLRKTAIEMEGLRMGMRQGLEVFWPIVHPDWILSGAGEDGEDTVTLSLIYVGSAGDLEGLEAYIDSRGYISGRKGLLEPAGGRLFGLSKQYSWGHPLDIWPLLDSLVESALKRQNSVLMRLRKALPEDWDVRMSGEAAVLSRETEELKLIEAYKVLPGFQVPTDLVDVQGVPLASVSDVEGLLQELG